MVKKNSALSPLGNHIRNQVIPPGMSVTEAARKLGIGRPALSNLLNANAALSPEMIVRLETTFGADRQKLLLPTAVASPYGLTGCAVAPPGVTRRSSHPWVSSRAVGAHRGRR